MASILTKVLLDVPNPNEGAVLNTAFLESLSYAFGAGNFSAPRAPIPLRVSVPNFVERLVKIYVVFGW